MGYDPRHSRIGIAAGVVVSTLLAGAFVLSHSVLAAVLLFSSAFTTMLLWRAHRRASASSRWRGQGRCGRCGDNLTGNVSGICSECGERIEATSRKDQP